MYPIRELGVEVLEDVDGVVRFAEDVVDISNRVGVIPRRPPFRVGNQPLLLCHREEGGFENFEKDVDVDFLNAGVDALIVNGMNGVAPTFEDLSQ